MEKQGIPSLLNEDYVILLDETLDKKEEGKKEKKKDIRNQMLFLLEIRAYGLSIEEISKILKINRTTASKYLFALEAEGLIVSRSIGKAKLHYLKKHYNVKGGGSQ